MTYNVFDGTLNPAQSINQPNYTSPFHVGRPGFLLGVLTSLVPEENLWRCVEKIPL